MDKKTLAHPQSAATILTKQEHICSSPVGCLHECAFSAFSPSLEALDVTLHVRGHLGPGPAEYNSQLIVIVY
jgi:hypothetical protein